MKKMLIASTQKGRLFLCTCLTALLAVAAQAQDIMVVHPHEAAPQQFEVANIDSMTWENATTLHIYLRNQAAQDFAIANVDSLTWLVISPPEPPITVGQVELGEGEAFVINDSLTEVRSTDCTVRFSPTVVEGSTKLVIRRATSVPPVTIDGLGVDETYDISQDAVAVDVSLGDLHELDGIVEIRIPLKVGPDEVPGVAWYNEETLAWEPIDYDYDAQKGEVVVWSDHLSILECYRIKNEHTRNAQLVFYSVPYPDNSTDELLQLVDDAVSGTFKWGDLISNHLSVFKQFGFDITWNAFNAGGVQSELYEKANKMMGTVGTLCASYDILRAGLSGDSQTAGINTMKLMLSKVTDAMSNAIGTSVMTAAMCAVAIIDYALNKMWETSWSDRQDLYRRCYTRYYQRDHGDGLKHHYTSARQWYNILLPVFQKGSPTIEAVNNEIKQIIDNYVNEYWNLSDDEQILYWEAVGGPSWSYTGGLSNALKKELADNHKAELYNDILPPVFEAIGREMRAQSYEILYNGMKEYAALMNQVIRLELAGQEATEGTSWKGCKVRFKNLPSAITDPKNWEASLNEEGKGSIRFRLYAYTSEGVKPTLELVDKKGKVLRDIDFTFGEGINNIDLGEAPEVTDEATLVLASSAVTLDTKGTRQQVRVTTNRDNVMINLDADWLHASYDQWNRWLNISADANSERERRSATITVTVMDFDNTPLSKQVKVTQEGTDDLLRIWDGVDFKNFWIDASGIMFNGFGRDNYVGTITTSSVGNVVTVEAKAMTKNNYSDTRQITSDSITIKASIDKMKQVISATMTKYARSETRYDRTRHLYEYTYNITVDSIPLSTIRKYYDSNYTWADGTTSPAKVTSAIRASLDKKYITEYHTTSLETYWQLPQDYWNNPSETITGTFMSTAKSTEKNIEDVKGISDFRIVFHEPASKQTEGE